jgi:hypothetical protein
MVSLIHCAWCGQIKIWHAENPREYVGDGTHKYCTAINNESRYVTRHYYPWFLAETAHG